MAEEILIIDDEEDIRNSIAGLLQDENYEVKTVENSDKALEAISERLPDLILIDIWLENSKLDGLELLNEIQSKFVSLPCVMISGHGNIDIAVNAGTPKILKGNIMDSVNIGILNCHPSLLPNYRGCTSIEWAIYNDDPIGNTVHMITDKIDQGQIILQENITFSKSDKYHDVRVRVYKHGFKLIAKAIKKIINGTCDNNQSTDTDGRYYGVIEEDKMEVVLQKINSGKYLYQV